MSSAQLGSSDTTRYKWSFAKKLNQFDLDSVRDNVDSMTNQSRGDDKVAAGRRRNVGPSMPTNTVGKEYNQNIKKKRLIRYRSS